MLQDCEFPANAASAARRIRVIESPVAMNEAEHRTTLRIAAQKSVPAQIHFPFVKHSQQIRGSVMIMMKMHFGFVPSHPADFRERINDVRIILFDGIEKGMLRTAALVIAGGLGHGGQSLKPLRQTAHGTLLICPMERFEMIANSQHHIGDMRLGSAQVLPHPWQQPFIKSFNHEARDASLKEDSERDFRKRFDA